MPHRGPILPLYLQDVHQSIQHPFISDQVSMALGWMGLIWFNQAYRSCPSGQAWDSSGHVCMTLIKVALAMAMV